MHIASGHQPVIVRVPLDGNGSDIEDGALIGPGTTAGTDMGVFIKTTNAIAGADALGTLRGIHDFDAVGDSTPEDGLVQVWGEVELCDAYMPLWVEYDQSDTVVLTTNSGTTLTPAGTLEDNIDSSWIFNTTAGVKQLSYLVASASGSATQKTAMGWTAADTLIKILRLGHQVVKLNTAGDKIGTDAAVGSWTVFVLENWFKATGYTLQMLDPTKHDNLTLENARFYTKLYARNTAGHTTE